MAGSVQDMMNKIKANRRLQRKRRNRIEDKRNDLQQMNKVRTNKVFNKEFLNEKRPEVLENRRRLAIELEKVQWENKVKTLVSLALTAMILLFWLESCF